MSRPPDELYSELLTHLRQVALLESCGAVLGWDEQTCLPAGGAELRSDQAALLAGLAHERATAPVVGELLGELESRGWPTDPNSPERANLREVARAYRRATALPRRLVEELSKTTSLSQQAWVQARKQRRFSLFLPHLERVVALRREAAQALARGQCDPYDALIDEYEAGVTAADIDRLFQPLRRELVALMGEIAQTSRRPPVEILARNYPIDAQREFSLQAATEIGFNFEEGRLDIAAHPFCSGIGPGDCRLTTRYDAHHFPGAFFGTLHEAGHGIYEQGLNRGAWGTPLGAACSLGVHESQSRMWENMVGRSRAFWERMFPRAQQVFPEALRDVSLADFHAAINDVRPSFIRVEADEVTYNLHIMLRFELEQLLVSGRLAPADLPGAWNERFQRDFGLTPAHDSEGCLQDVHWSAGYLGYFPTYCLGNMIAAQLFETARSQLGDLDAAFRAGEFRPLKEWLNTNIHTHGKRWPTAELVQRVTGKPLSPEPLVRHLRGRFGPLFGL
ncbi:MAG: carboxypeptidase M32 [Planctomycetaceae bacterium]